MKTIYYYQTFVGLDQLLSHVQDIDVIIVSSIHFDRDKQGNKYIYLNDNKPNDPCFDTLWTDVQKAYSQGVCITLMIGGAGGAYQELFSDFDTYYPQLVSLLNEKNFICGIDLDIEEEVDINQVKMLINCLIRDFGEQFIITMAPIAPSLMNDQIGMGGFVYKELYNSPEGKYIQWFNTQCYESFSYDTYKRIIDNGYPPEKIVMGMMSGQFNKQTFKNAIHECVKIKQTYPEFPGVYDWEYLNAPPDKSDPSQWCKLLKNIRI
jgi:chitinase